MSTPKPDSHPAGAPALADAVGQLILPVRGERVLLDADLATLYGVETKALVRAVKRNIERFPPDFMLQITEDEWASLRCQIGTSNTRGGRRYAPYAFTEQGVAMLSSVLRSEQAVRVNIEIMRAFVAIRRALITPSPEGMADRVSTLEHASRVHGDRLSTIEATLAAMDSDHPHTVLNINVQGDMVNARINTAPGLLDTLEAHGPRLGLDAEGTRRFQEAILAARSAPPASPRWRESLLFLKAVAENAGGAVIGHGIITQLAKLLR